MANHLVEEERAGCFTLIVILMSGGCYCSLPLPHVTGGWSAVCDCGILTYVFIESNLLGCGSSCC